MQTNMSKIKHFGDKILQNTLDYFTKNNITFLMPAFYPQRGGVLVDAANNGAKVVIAGGQKGQQIFKGIPQYGLASGTTGIEETQEGLNNIVSQFPKDISGKVAVFSEAPLGYNAWGKSVENHLGNVDIVATNEQSLRLYFEEKVNLTAILKKAGLEKHIIPSQIVNFPMSKEDIIYTYNNLKNKDGKVVVQSCGQGVNESGGGYTTAIISSLTEFAKYCQNGSVQVAKVAKFIDGYNSNLSFCTGNLVPSPTMLGAAKTNLTESDPLYSAETIDLLIQRAEQMGINKDTVFNVVVPSTLKVVGDPNLTPNPTSGVGNMINYHFDNETSEQIYDIGNKLGTLLALCGKVGLAGADLIITKEGEIYINEINDRQQGTTEKTSLHCEKNGIPGIHHISFLQNYANLNNGAVQLYMQMLKENQHEIFEATRSTSSPFYIKVVGKEDVVAQTSLSSGKYMACKNDDNSQWTWHLGTNLETEESFINLEDGQVIADITDADIIKGQSIHKGEHILRINGEVIEDSENPFLINADGQSVLNTSWIEPISALYSQLTVPVEVKSIALKDASMALTDSATAAAPITEIVQE